MTGQKCILRTENFDLLQRTARPGGEQYIQHRPVDGKFNTKHAAVSAMARQGLGKAVLSRLTLHTTSWTTRTSIQWPELFITFLALLSYYYFK